MADQALLVMDVQRGIVDRFVAQAETVLDALERATGAARTAGIPVVYVRIAFRPGVPEVSRSNRAFAAVARASGFGDEDEATQIHPQVAPHAGDIVVLKKRVSAFAGSDLEVVLRSLQVRSLVLSGIATSGVVLSTLRQAADLDYELTVLCDCCADGDDEVHRVLLDKVFPRQATVLDVDDWTATLDR